MVFSFPLDMAEQVLEALAALVQVVGPLGAAEEEAFPVADLLEAGRRK